MTTETMPAALMMSICYTLHKSYDTFYAILLADCRRGEQVVWEYFTR